MSQIQKIRDVYIQLTYLMKKLIDPIMEKTKKHTNHLNQEAYSFIEKKYRYPIGLNDIAAYLDVTPQYQRSFYQSDRQEFYLCACKVSCK